MSSFLFAGESGGRNRFPRANQRDRSSREQISPRDYDLVEHVGDVVDARRRDEVRFRVDSRPARLF